VFHDSIVAPQTEHSKLATCRLGPSPRFGYSHIDRIGYKNRACPFMRPKGEAGHCEIELGR